MGRVKELMYLPPEMEEYESLDETEVGWVAGQRYLGVISTCYSHIFPDTGLLKSWCKNCGAEGEFDRITCTFKLKGKK